MLASVTRSLQPHLRQERLFGALRTQRERCFVGKDLTVLRDLSRERNARVGASNWVAWLSLWLSV